MAVASGRPSDARGDLLANLSRHVPGVIYQYQLFPDGRSCFPFASDAMREVYEVTPEDVREDASPVFARLHPDDFDDVAASIRQSAETLEDWQHDYRVVLPEQGVRWRRGNARPERLADGSILWHGCITDITDLKRTQDALRQKEAAIAASMTGIAIADLEGTLTYVNRAFLDIWGYRDEADVLGRPAVSFWGTPEDAAAVLAAVQCGGTWSGELVARRSDDTARQLQVQAGWFPDSSGSRAGLFGSFHDVTEARRLQERLADAQKMESIGRLAGGVAHDFNNLLTVIKGYLSLALASLPASSPGREELHHVERAAVSAAALTQQLLAFSRRQLLRPVILDVNQVVVRVQPMLTRLLGEDIELRTALAADVWPVRFDAGQAEQVLVNLAVNARDAMPEGGRLTIETTNVTSDDPGEAAGEYVRISVTDTGCGMTPEVRSHIFEPFFTTKQPGAGTGLGLAMVGGAVAQNGGRTEVESAPGAGTSFRIYLPRETTVSDPAPRPPGTPATPGGHERILLVEDDAQVRALGRRLLSHLGYEVTTCASGREALDVVRAGRRPFDLLVTDVVLPEINGRELADRLLAQTPSIRVLFTSAYTANVIVQRGVTPDGTDFLPKPYTLDVLARRVREVLDRDRSPR